MMRCFCAVLLLAGLIRSPTALAGTASEFRLPGFQTAALDQDLPAIDAVLAGDETLWFLGKHNLWSWRLAESRLARISLPQGEWQKLHFDGLSIYVAGSTGLFQVQIEQKRYFSYDLPLSTAKNSGESLGFGGEGDDLWLAHAQALIKIDRYGKNLTPKFPGLALTKDDLVAYDPTNQVLWVARAKQLLRLASGSAPKVALTAKHPLTGLAFSGGQVILHTAHSVLRLDAASGKTLKSIPVQGGRKLLAMAVSNEQHTYIFDDHLLEVFDLKNKVARSYHLPLESPASSGPEGSSDPSGVQVVANGQTAAVLIGGRPHAYRLAP